MTDFTTTARAALIALIAAAPMSVFAAETGSPAQSIAADPDESAEADDGVKTTGESMEDTAKANQGEDAYEDADVVKDADGSLVEDDAKNDD
ncbi:hypothetical protein OS189_08145 [Sulfitobacter sp. F26169L]|uniref:hypothetical protein n=1 Tax=Sulfitobacter sp. F26169L TaxID=2996015 RepID=UPI002260F58C|nr:hypothetical protein [Sulfitobacter sp. F26169L]MCX7566312.1 hypothetical protein [Sulfitobacter sp. F26169L]